MYQKRIEALIKSVPTDVVFITSPENLYYFSGFTGGEGALFFDKDRRFLLTDSRYTVQAKNETHDFEIIDIAEKPLAALLKEEGKKLIGFEDDFVTFQRFLSLKKFSEELTWFPVSNHILNVRMIKDETEISYIKEAAKIADDAFSHIITEINPGKTEWEIALSLEFFMKKHGAEGLSFDTIVASGIRSALPHGTATYKKIETGDFVTLDFGCKYKGYSSDMTRTVVIGRANEKQKEIYQTVLSAQLAALHELTAGVPANTVDLVARNIIKDAGYGKYFGHGLGHSLGLNVHEKPSLAPKSEDILMPGMLMTVEPGIYIEQFGGVRIEDLVLITENGCENLTSSEKELLVL